MWSNRALPACPAMPPVSSPRPADPAAGPPSGGEAALQLPFALAALLLALGSALVAAAGAYGLVALAGLAPQAAAAWAAAAAALLAVLPVLVLVRRGLANEAGTAGPRPGASGLGQPRALFLEQAEREWARARRYGSGAALLVVDVDRYAALCESRGAEAGDAALNALLRNTAPTLRGADLLTRLSDQQMAVFLAPADATGALDVAERIRERAEQLDIAFHPQKLRISVSVGVAHLRAAHLNLQAVLDDAQDALLAARSAGGNCVRAAPVDLGRARRPGSWRADPKRQNP